MGAPDFDPTLRDAGDVAARLGVEPATGLSAGEAAARLKRGGPNALRPEPSVPLWRRVFAQLRDPLVSLLLAAIVISSAAWFAEGASGAPIDALVIAAIVVANAALGVAQEARAASAVAALAVFTAARSTVLRDGLLTAIPSAELVAGDILVLAEGDAVGADARLLSATALRVQEASLTGESEPVDKDAERLPASVPLGDRSNMVFRGTAVVHGVGRAVVTSTGMDTELGHIADLLEETESAPTPLQREIAAVSKALGLAVVVIAIVVMAATALAGGVHGVSDAVTVLLMGVSLAVAAVPEGLVAILSVVLALGVRAMAERNAVVKRLHSVETLGSATVICSDKTGTLTRNQMTLRVVATASGEVELTGSGYHPAGRAVPRGEITGDLLHEAGRVLVGGSLANNAQFVEVDGEWRIQGDPTEAAFLVAQHKLEGTRDQVARFTRQAEVPFTSERKLMSVVGRDPAARAPRLFTKGAPDILLGRCDSIQAGHQVLHLDESRRAAALADVERLSRAGYRTLGVAFRLLGDEPESAAEPDESTEYGLVYLGVVGIVDPPREEALAAVREAHRAGIRTVMITGDHPVTARRVAEDVGIAGSGARVCTGAELEAMSGDDLRVAARSVSVYARVAPEHKLRIVRALQGEGQVVAMTGDGVNDAPALKAADIGVAMGISGTEVSKQAGAMILADDNFATIVAAIRQGRIIFDNLTKVLRYLLSSNLGEVATVLFGVVFASALGLTAASAGELVVPLLATQILWINLITDAAPALALGLDPEIDDVMARPPRPPRQPILDAAMWRQIVAVGLLMGVVTLVTYDLFLPGGLVPGGFRLEVARTAAFTTLVFAQLFNALNARSAASSAFRGIASNRWLWAALAFGAAMQVVVVEVPSLQALFGTTSLEPRHWAVTVAMASIVLWAQELTKWVLRRTEAPEPAE